MQTSPEEIAEWMLSEYSKANRLVQRAAARQIRQLFGEEHVYKNKNRNWAINKPVLDKFREITGDDVVWSRSRQLWRQRRETDPHDTRMVR